MEQHRSENLINEKFHNPSERYAKVEDHIRSPRRLQMSQTNFNCRSSPGKSLVESKSRCWFLSPCTILLNHEPFEVSTPIGFDRTHSSPHSCRFAWNPHFPRHLRRFFRSPNNKKETNQPRQKFVDTHLSTFSHKPLTD